MRPTHDAESTTPMVTGSPLDLAHTNAIELAEQGAFEAAAAAFQAVLDLDPGQAAAWSNLGMMLKVLGRVDDAIAAHDRAVALAPTIPRLRVNRAVALLHAGRWSEAWPDYEARLREPDHRGPPLSTLLPNLDQLDDLNGVTILAMHEDGFGDTLHFMRYLPLLVQRGARVLAWVPESLVRVVARLPGVRPLVASGPLPDFDFHCPMFSLPRVFASTPTTVPSAPYLTLPQDLVTAWSHRLPAREPSMNRISPSTSSRSRFRVGFAWAGQARPWLEGFQALDARRGIPVDALTRLATIPGVRGISLQAGQSNCPPWLHDPMPGVRDFADTAAIIANLDLVVSVDTSVVHVAGALGKPVLMLDRHDNCWRWLRGRSDSPWYPSLTILRQERPWDWRGPLERAEAAITGLVAFNAPVGAPAACPPATTTRPSRRPRLRDAA